MTRHLGGHVQDVIESRVALHELENERRVGVDPFWDGFSRGADGVGDDVDARHVVREHLGLRHDERSDVGAGEGGLERGDARAQRRGCARGEEGREAAL